MNQHQGASLYLGSDVGWQKREPLRDFVPVLTSYLDFLVIRAKSHEDVVAAVDVVVTKPGYGIISECAANDTALLYTDRGHFIEYDVLVREMPRYVRCAYLPQAKILTGHWQAALDQLIAAPGPAARQAVDGADVAARWILAQLDRA